jgi:flavin-dependent dehydrogenase
MGYGMRSTIVSGYYAGKYSAEAIKSGNYEALKNYEREVRKRFNRRTSYVFSHIFESLDNKDLDTLIKMANDLDRRTDVDDLMDQLTLSGLFHVLSVFVKTLPSSGRLLAKSCKGLW